MRGWGIAGVFVGLALVLPATASADTLTVNEFLDGDSDGVCDGTCTVRDAITTADQGDAILLPPGTHSLSIGAAGEDANAGGDLDLVTAFDALTIRGTGATPGATVIDATGLGDRVFDFSGEAEYLVANLTIRGGSGAEGGGIRNQGTELTLSEVVLDDNSAPNTGGAILNGSLTTAGSRLTILNSVLSGNRTLAGAGGGAIFNHQDGRLAIVSSLLSGNDAEGADGSGGAINNRDAGSLNLSDSRLLDNEAFGDGTGEGGGALMTQNESTATVADSLIAGNESHTAAGGIRAQNDTSLTVIDTTIRDNQAQGIGTRGGGGVLAANDSAVAIIRSTLSGNQSFAGGGALRRLNDGVLEIIGSTVHGNSATDPGGGVRTDSTFFGRTRIDRSTITQNTSATAGGGIYNAADSDLFEPLILGGTIVSGNLVGVSQGNCAAEAGAPSLVSRGFNLDSGASCGFNGGGDRQNADAALGPLADNGGPTQTRLPGLTGAAVDAGTAGGYPGDQRGLPRTVDQPTVSNAAGSDGTDIGAVELSFVPAPTATKKFDLKGAIKKCKKRVPKGKRRANCIKKAKQKAKQQA